jgi:hypothetical protein
MALTFTIGSVTYAESGLPVSPATSGKYARQFDPGAPVEDINKFRVPGTDGSLVLRNGTVGHKILVSVRYIYSSIATLEAAIAADLSTFSTAAQNIVMGGKTYTGCNLVPGSVKRTSSIMATGRVAGQVFVDLAMVFSEDQPTGS